MVGSAEGNMIISHTWTVSGSCRDIPGHPVQPLSYAEVKSGAQDSECLACSHTDPETPLRNGVQAS